MERAEKGEKIKTKLLMVDSNTREDVIVAQRLLVGNKRGSPLRDRWNVVYSTRALAIDHPS